MPLNLDISSLRHGTELIKRGFASMQKGGVIMDVTNAEQAAIAEEAGSVAVMALERVPSDIRAEGGVARMADPLKVLEIMDAVTIPVMAKCRIGHISEAFVLQSLGVDMIDESEVLTLADPFHHVDKRAFTVPFVCGARDLGEALRRISEGAAMIRTKGEPGTGNIVEAVRHQRVVMSKIRSLKGHSDEELNVVAREINAPFELVKETATLQRLPVVNFAAGGIASPADAALMMLLGSDGIFVGSGIFKSKNPQRMAKAVVEATLHYDDPSIVAEVSKGLGESMPGIEISKLSQEQRMQERGY
jgi:pyridoxal 5'-phosphate synthase pdxS subunit